MAGQAGEGEQLPKKQNPSRLRNEVRPQSTDDERDRTSTAIQVPNSDTIVPETQPGHAGEFHRDDPVADNESEFSLSPNSAALLERTAVTKKTDTTGCILSFGKLLSRNPIGRNDSSASAAPSPNPFAISYSQTRKVSSKPPPKEVTTAAQSAHLGLRTPDIQKHKGHAPREPAHVPPPCSPDNAHLGEPCTTSNQHMDVVNQTATGRSQEEPTYTLPPQANAISRIPPSAQLNARPASGINRVTGVKKGKKHRKEQLSQQCPGSRPRSRITPSHTRQTGTIGGPAPDTSNDPRCLSQSNADGDGLHAFRAPLEDRQRDAYAQESQLPNEEHGCIADNKESCNTIPSLMDTTFRDFQDSSAQRQFPTASVQVPSILPKTLDTTEPTQQSLTTFHDQARSLGPDKRVALSTQTSGPYALPNSHEPVEAHAVTTQSHQPSLYADNDGVARQPGINEAHPHGVPDREGLHRITKSRRKLRPSGPISYGTQGQAVSPSVEQAMETVRVALLANKYRVQHETTTLTQKHKTELAELQRTIDNQIQSIADHDRRYQDLKKTLSQLTNTAKTNSRFVKGLQQDSEDLQKSAISFQKECGKALTEKITELEDEKQALQKEVGTMTDKLAATQRKMRSTLDDLWIRFLVSESKREDLAKNLGKQEAALKEERKNRNEFEKQFFSDVQSIPRQVVDSSVALTKKIELLQATLDNTTAHGSQNDHIKECLEALQPLRLAPVLTTQDIDRMNSTLNLVHERLDSGLDTLSKTVTSTALSNAELQEFIKEQINGLQTEMLRYEEVAAENRKTHESNVCLKSQLDAQQEHCTRLEEQVKGYEKAEVDLKASCEQLKRELKVLEDAPPIDTSGLEQEAFGLRQKLQKAEEDLTAVNTKVREIERERDTYEEYCEDVKMQLRELQQRPTLEEHAAVQEQIAKNCQSEFLEKERSFKREIQRLTIDRDEKEKTFQELNDKLNVAETQLDELSKNIRTLESKSAEITDLQAQLQNTAEELHSKKRDCADFKRRFEEKTEKISELQGLYSNLQAEVTQHQTTMQTMRRDANNEITKMRQHASNTLQLSSNQVSNLQEEKKSLSTRLEQAQMNEAKLQHEVAELRAAREADISRVQAKADEKSWKLAEQHRIEVDDWRRRMSQKDAALEEMEAKMRLAEDQHKTKIATDREKAESNMRKLEEQYRDSLRVIREQGNLNQQVGFQVHAARGILVESGEATQAAKPRKKVSRQNHSMLEVSEEQDSHPKKPSSVFHAESSQSQLEDDDLFATQFEEQGEIDDISNETIDVYHKPRTATESHDAQNLSMTQDASKGDLSRAPQRQLKHQVSSSSDLSNMSTDELTVMEKSQPASTGMLGGRDRNGFKSGNASSKFSQTLEETQCVPSIGSRNYNRDPFHRGTVPTDTGFASVADNDSVANSQSSRSSGRPKSQANTASRMMPPHSNSSDYPRPSVEGHAVDLGASTRHTMYGSANLKLSSNNSRPSKLSSPKQIYSQHESRRSAPTGLQHSSSQDMKQEHTKKRKSSIDQTERHSATKKQRSKSQPRPFESSPGLPSQSSCVAVTRPKAQKIMPYSQVGAATSSQSKAQVLSSRPRARISRQAPSSGDAYFPRGQSSSHVAASGPIRRSSTRITRGKGKNSIAFGKACNERFNRELDQWR
ncbi:unnamed protein product [Alternaria burnsii]|nr:unnamed protein product [Alternaria burnsii]